MHDRLDERVTAALRDEVDRLPLRVSESMVEERLTQGQVPAWFAMTGAVAAGIIFLAAVVLGLSLAMGWRQVGPPLELPRAPEIDCGRAGAEAGMLECDTAIRAALAAVPADSDPLTRATFLRGRVFWCSDGCAEDIHREATVVVETAGDGPDLFIPLRANRSGGDVVAGVPDPVPGGEFRAEESDSRAAWDYLALGVGFTGSASWPRLYASLVEEDLGVSLSVVREAAPASLLASARAGDALERIRTDARLRERIRQAEFVTIGPGIEELREPMLAYAAGFASCGGDDNQDCLRQAMSQVKGDWEALLDELVGLRSPEEANMIAITQAAWLADWACDGWGNPCWEVLAGYWVDFYGFVADSARARGLKVADTLNALHAPGVFQAPVNPAFVASNGMDLTDEASAVVADVLRSVGY